MATSFFLQKQIARPLGGVFRVRNCATLHWCFYFQGLRKNPGVQKLNECLRKGAREIDNLLFEGQKVLIPSEFIFPEVNIDYGMVSEIFGISDPPLCLFEFLRIWRESFLLLTLA